MGNVIKKTALITLLALVSVLLVSVFSVTLLAPSFAGDCYFELGFKDMAVSCYERAFGSSGSYSDLVELVDSASYSENDSITAKYGKIMIERKIEFAEFCKVTDEDGQSNFSTYDYYSTLVTFAFYDLGDKSSAADICFKTLENGGYTDGCALKTAVQIAKDDKEFGELLISAYKALPSRNFANNTQNKFKDDMRKLGYTIS